ncbi:MAG: dimethyl sulfoxide reductase anchor subunit, partial [Fimbriimonadaceae bacterium]|nr:dimethyl sulfoxide reductase anchor subunit [Alphaproteobacteria bacterium]
IIWFTTLSGAGYGLAAFLGLGIAPVTGLTALIAYGISFALIGAGLLSSTLHLGHPERAWRAFSQWRSSWLSREGVLAVTTFVPLSICTLAAVFFELALPITGLILAILATCTVYATSMIYASLRTVHHWYSRFTPACYLGFAASSGFLLLTAISRPFLETGYTPIVAIDLITFAWILKGIWWYRADTSASASTIQSALGLPGNSGARRLELPHTGTNYLLKEMGYSVARKHARKLRIIAVFFGLAVPALLLYQSGVLSGLPAQACVIFAALSHYAGIVVERWLFFAQARHAVTLYYGAQTV